MNLFDTRLPESFWDRVTPEPNSGCWLWLGSQTRNGYGRCEIGGHNLAHRVVVAALLVLPVGMTIDHRCNNKLCVNPSHMHMVTSAENSRLRSERRAVCPNGHTRINRRGDCRECARNRSRRFKAKRKPISDALGLWLGGVQ